MLGRFFRRLALDFLDLGLQLRGRRRGVGLFVGEALLQGSDGRFSRAGFLRLRLELVLQRFDMDAKRGDFLPLRLRGAEGFRRLDLGGIGEGRAEIEGDLVGRGPAHAERQQQRAGGGGVEARLARAAMDRREFDFRRAGPRRRPGQRPGTVQESAGFAAQGVTAGSGRSSEAPCGFSQPAVPEPAFSIVRLNPRLTTPRFSRGALPICLTGGRRSRRGLFRSLSRSGQAARAGRSKRGPGAAPRAPCAGAMSRRRRWCGRR